MMMQLMIPPFFSLIPMILGLLDLIQTPVKVPRETTFPIRPWSPTQTKIRVPIGTISGATEADPTATDLITKWIGATCPGRSSKEPNLLERTSQILANTAQKRSPMCFARVTAVLLASLLVGNRIALVAHLLVKTMIEAAITYPWSRLA
jgi:hypothetical protein